MYSKSGLLTYHIHIKGIVQGVGFRPFVFRKASEDNILGTVSNTTDGVHIIINAYALEDVQSFAEILLKEAPERARITSLSIHEWSSKHFSDFQIITSTDTDSKEVLLTPDFAICETCKHDILSNENRRGNYAFTTCTLCGPRYSIIEKLPYDRGNTAMDFFVMCPTCKKEYNKVTDRRYYSQTNSCPTCAIELSLERTSDRVLLEGSQEEHLEIIVRAWAAGEIIAIKGIGGYLITCDATNPAVVKRLRTLKHRPSKPFAVMYHDFYLMAEDVDVDVKAMLEIQDVSAPIVLLPKKSDPWSDIAFEEIAPGLSKVGVMLPYAPLYVLLLKKFGKPIVATSGNISGDPIEFKNEQASQNLSEIVDLIVHNNRDIRIAQDDSVLNITPIKRNSIVIRRARGLAPIFIQTPPVNISTCVLAMGASLKSTIGLTANGNVYISQYLGNTEYYLTQKNYIFVLDHLLKILDVTPTYIICDSHPSYFSTQEGERLADLWNVPIIQLQHHKAHFYAILGEHNKLDSDDRIMGVIWDGTGLGDDKHIWGGEFFSYEKKVVSRIDHIPYYQHVLGDKMAREPRISALSILHSFGFNKNILISKFSQHEWDIYERLMGQKSKIKSSSIGRLFDAVACILLGKDRQTYEGEAAMLLEDAAHHYLKQHNPDMKMSYLDSESDSKNIIIDILEKLINDKERGVDTHFIAARFHVSLVDYIDRIAAKYHMKSVCFSGGVFQNAWLVDLIQILLKAKYRLYFHKELSPNDENIAFGQLMYYYQNHNQ